MRRIPMSDDRRQEWERLRQAGRPQSRPATAADRLLAIAFLGFVAGGLLGMLGTLPLLALAAWWGIPVDPQMPLSLALLTAPLGAAAAATLGIAVHAETDLRYALARVRAHAGRRRRR